MSTKDSKSRKYQITINNPLDKGFDHNSIKRELTSFKSLKYYCMADEIGLETKKPHTHIYVAFSSPVRFSTIKKHFPDAHIEKAVGTSQENRDYIRKEGKYSESDKKETNLPDTFEEFGDIPIERQGARNDLATLYEMIKDGMSNYEILEAEPDFLLRISDIERVRQTILTERFKTQFRHLEITYIYGPTGSGKTRSVMEFYGYSSIYRVTDYSHPFDNYCGQDIILFEEYRSDFKIGSLLNYLDGYPLELPARYANKVACYTKVFIISNLDLSSQYGIIQMEQPATWNALMRRINTVIHLTENGRYECSSDVYRIATENDGGFIEIYNKDDDNPFEPQQTKIEEA